MEDPEIVDKKPLLKEVEPGTYFWCACGKSSEQPFCDGSHSGTGLAPILMEFTEKKTIAFCMCKHSSNGGFCDGSHKNL